MGGQPEWQPAEASRSRVTIRSRERDHPPGRRAAERHRLELGRVPRHAARARMAAVIDAQAAVARPGNTSSLESTVSLLLGGDHRWLVGHPSPYMPYEEANEGPNGMPGGTDPSPFATVPMRPPDPS